MGTQKWPRLIVAGLGVGICAVAFWAIGGLGNGSDPKDVQAEKRRGQPGHLDSSAGASRSIQPPVQEVDMPEPVAHPEYPPDMAAVGREAYHEALEDAGPRPAMTAFRRMVNAYITYNRQFADAQAQAEGLTVEEVEELTAFGFLAQRSIQWDEVERVLGKDVDPYLRSEVHRVLEHLNDEFTEGMRKMVSAGALYPDRWQYIQELQKRYFDQYFAMTEMDEEGLEALLVGDIRLPRSSSELPGPGELAKRSERLPETTPTRPGEALP